MKAGRIVLVLMAAFVVVMLSLSAYVWAYVALGEYTDYRGNIEEAEPGDCVVRHYGQREWARTVFKPAAAVEETWIGCPVLLTYRQVPLESVDFDINNVR